MAQDNQPEKEAKEEILEEMPDFEVEEKQPADSNQPTAEKPTIPDVSKPQIPQEKNIPAGGPGDQGQNQQTSAQSQTDEERVKKIKIALEKPIPINTPQERKKSSEIENRHNKDVLGQN